MLSTRSYRVSTAPPFFTFLVEFQCLSESDKTQLHSDAKRLFQSDTAGHTPDGEWAAQYNVRYHSRRQEARHHERDGIRICLSRASCALFCHIFSFWVTSGNRLGPSWTVRHVIDWGAGSGSGLWSVDFPRVKWIRLYRLLQGDFACVSTAVRIALAYGRSFCRKLHTRILLRNRQESWPHFNWQENAPQ